MLLSRRRRHTSPLMHLLVSIFVPVMRNFDREEKRRSSAPRNERKRKSRWFKLGFFFDIIRSTPVLICERYFTTMAGVGSWSPEDFVQDTDIALTERDHRNFNRAFRVTLMSFSCDDAGNLSRKKNPNNVRIEVSYRLVPEISYFLCQVSEPAK